MAEVCRRLELPAGGQTYATLRAEIARLQLDTTSFEKPVFAVRPRHRWTDDELRAAVATSTSYSEALRRLGYRPSGGMHRWIKAKIRILDISTEHLRGQAWSRGRSVRRRPQVPLQDVLVRNSGYGSGRLRRRLIGAGLKQDICEGCGLDSWLGEPILLTLDHINGDHTDNRLANLRILCPNCHALTSTWCGRNRGRRTPTQRDQT